MVEFVSDLYPWARREVIDAETLGKMSHAEVWVQSIRTGLDDFAGSIFAHEIGNEAQAQRRMNEAEWHLCTGAYEAWIRTASHKAALLHKHLRSGQFVGDREMATAKSQECQALIAKARADHPNHDREAAANARQAAMAAISGLDVLGAVSAATPRGGGTLTLLGAIGGALLGATTGAVVPTVLGAAVLGLLARLADRPSSSGDDMHAD